MKISIASVLFITWATVTESAYASVHFVSPAGTASWEQSIDSSTPSSLTTANTEVNSGDTVLLLQGTYTGEYIKMMLERDKKRRAEQKA